MKPRLLFCAALLAGSLQPAAAAMFDCLIEPRQSIDIRAASEGLVTRVLVQRGDRVHIGQVLVELDAGLEKAGASAAQFRSQMQGPVQSRQSRLEFLAQKAARREQLVKEHFISVQDSDETASERRLAEAELLDANDTRKLAELEYQRAMEQLRLRTIRSPIEGIVVDRMIHPGELADNRDIRKPLLKLAEIQMLYVEVMLPSAAYGALKTGQQVEVLPDHPAGQRYTATVKVIDKVMDAASNSFGVRLELPNPAAAIPAGVRCKAMFANITDPVLARPAVARRESDKRR